MIQHHKYSLTEIEEMLPFEREIYIVLLKDHIEQENERIRKENAKMKR